MPAKDDFGDDGRYRVTSGQVKYILERTMRKFDAAPDRDTFMDALEAEALRAGDKYPVIHTGVFDGYQSLERLKDHLRDWMPGKGPAVDRTEGAPPAEAELPAVEENAHPSNLSSRRAARAQRADDDREETPGPVAP